MSEFDEWASNGGLDVKKFPMSNVYKNTDTRVASAAWDFKQAKIDELQARVDSLEKHLAIVLDQYYMEDRFSTKICNEAEKALNKDDRLNDSWYVKHVKPYSE